MSDRKIAVANNTACKTCQDVKTVYDVYVQSNGAVNPLSMGGFVSYANAQLALNSTVSDYTRALKDCGLWMSTLNFNGSSTTLESQTAAGFNPGTGDLTLEAWVNFSSLSGYRMIIDNTQDVGGVVRGFQLFAYNNHLYFGVFEGNNGNAQVQTSAALAGTGQWMHVAAVKTGYNPASYTIYINGNAVSTTANPSSGPTGSSGMNNTASLRLGVNKYSSTAQDYFSGAIKGVRIYGRSLSGAEIAGNYSSGCIKPITNRSNLLYEASINEGSGLTVSDQSGGHLASSITNGSWSTAIAPGTGCLTAADLAQQLCYFVSTTPNVSVAYFTGEVLSANDYYAFGANMPGRNFTSSSYRYGFNGKENDPETNTQDYGMRIYNPNLGKFLSVDPLTKEYPWLTPYQFASNRPICAIDRDGLEAADVGANIDFLVIVVQGWPATVGNPAKGNSQADNAAKTKPDLAKDDGLGTINPNTKLGNSSFPVNTQVVTFASSDKDDGGETVKDIETTINNYRKNNAAGKVILVGHSAGGYNLLQVVKNKEIKANLLIVIDPAAAQSGGAAIATLETVYPNVDNFIVYRNNVPDLARGPYPQVSGGRPDWKEGVNGTTITLNNYDHTSIDNKILPFVVANIMAQMAGLDPVKMLKSYDVPNKDEATSH